MADTWAIIAGTKLHITFKINITVSKHLIKKLKKKPVLSKKLIFEILILW